MNEKFNAGRLLIVRRSAWVFAIIVLCSALLIGKLVEIQIVNYDQYRSDSISQLTYEVEIGAKRGTIYDCNMKTLAVSSTVERIFISPNTIPNMSVEEYIQNRVDHAAENQKKNMEKALREAFDDYTISIKEDIANELSSLLGVEKSMVLEKANKTNRADETIKKKVELDEATPVREMVADKLYGRYIHFVEEAKRYYPYGDLASHVIGFVNADDNGVMGVEAYYDDILKGVPGKIVSAKDGVGGEMSSKYESYVSAQDGTDIMVTLDWTVQRIVEKHLQTALEETRAQNRVVGIVINVKDGSILASSVKPDYDLNSPYSLDEASLELLSKFSGTQEEKNKYETELLYSLWKNKAITELYEPGSTFKQITAAMVLEEELVRVDETFTCYGSLRIPNYQSPIHCHRRAGHGVLTFAGALQQSCNPVFIKMSERLGNDLFYKYYQAFGYTSKTGIDLQGETSNYFFDLNTFSNVDLAVASFGQNFKVTPISHLSAICSIANGGYLVTPHVLSAKLDENHNVLEQYNAAPKRQIISTETAKTLWTILEGAVESGGAKNAAVQGYRIAAKTGTSTKTEISTDDKKYYIASCVAFAPADDPEVAVMTIVDEPVGDYYGGVVAAPIASRILSEVLPYLGIDPQYSDEELESIGKTVGNYVGRSTGTAQNLIKQLGLEYKVVGKGSKVISQTPQAGTQLSGNGVVVLYTDAQSAEETVIVPDVIGMTAANVNKKIINSGLNLEIIDGNLSMMEGAIAISQSIAPGEKVAPGTVISVRFRHVDGMTD
ncbi:MAG: PASTA domain-containing protein [Ruminococcaceae bacterium]|nr:PASTA domain-containing protein [Oscillospiraceae bacterium]